MQRTVRILPTLTDLVVTSPVLIKGQRIAVDPSAGTKLAGKCGVVTGKGTTKSKVRVLLDGSKNTITLHVRFVKPA